MLFQRSAVCGLLVLEVFFNARGVAALHSRRAPALPPMFEENRGQFPASTHYLTRAKGYRVSFERGLARIVAGSAAPVDLAFLDGVQPRGVERMQTKLNYFRGSDPGKWVPGAAAYRQVEYRGAGGQALSFYWNPAAELEFDLTLPPGMATPSLRLSGQTSVAVSAAGDLAINAGAQSLTLRKPVVYQVVAGIRRPVKCHYVLGDNGLVEFHLGDYDPKLIVTIDPTLSVVTGTYLGGSGTDDGRAVAVDSSGNTYIAGDTTSSDFPLTNPLQNSLNGGQDAFIAKLNPSGSAVLFATYLGGSAGDQANGIGLDSTGNIYVAGTTHSSDFPLKNAVIGMFHSASGYTGFVAKLNPTGSALLYSTYMGGSTGETINGLAADSTGNAYVAGGTLSIDYPVMNGYQTVSQNPVGFDQPFLTRLSPSGTIAYSTISNAFGSDAAAVAADNNGTAVFTSSTNSTSAPVKSAYQSQPAGGLDAYVVKVDTKQSGASSLLFATFLGGSALEQVKAIALDSTDNVYVAGTTQSANFPISNAFQIAPGHSFLTKLASSGSSLIFSTYLGGNGTNIAALATDVSGNVYATGQDIGANSPFPLSNSLAGQTQPGFVSAFSFSGSLIYATYVGAGGVMPLAIAASAGGNATITGQSYGNLPVTPGAVQPMANGSNAFVVTLQYAQPAVLTTTSVAPNQGGDSGFTTVAVRGLNILAGASLTLKSSTASVTAFTTSVAVDSRGINGTFDLRHLPDGPYDVVVANPDSTTATLSRAFTVTLGGAPQLYVNVLGSTTLPTRENLVNLRVAGARTVTVEVGNNGTADAYAVPVTAEIGAGVNYILENTLTPPPQNPNLPPIDFSQVPISASDGTTTYVGLIVPWIPAGGTTHFRLTLTAPISTPAGYSTSLNLQVGKPYLIVNPNGAAISGTVARRSLFNTAAIQPETQIDVTQIAAQFITSPDGRVCLLNIIQLALQILKVVPGVNCGEDLLQQVLFRELSQGSALAVQGAAQNGSLSLSDVQSSIVQTDVSALQVILDCSGISAPLASIVSAVGSALTLVNTIDSCTNFLVRVILQLVNSSDPNVKDGPPGVGTPLYISGTIPAPYAIEFENVATASAPAGKVVVTDQLNPQLVNLSTFSFGTIGFGSTAVTPLPGVSTYSTKVDLRPARNTIVAVNAGIDNAGLITWTFQSLDPTTLQPITDPLQGFLPPNTQPPNGQGFVNFSISLKPGLSSGTTIPNQASVVFDNNAAILTNVWQNTIDSTPPTSHVTALPATESSNVFPVNWSGADTGSGIQNFTVFNSVNGGPFTPWISGTAATSASCVAAPNSTQAFFTIATDAAGNVEAGKMTPETSTQVANVQAITINTNPPGLLVSVDNGTPQAAPLNVVWQIGSQHMIAATTPQGSNGTQFNFTNWSDAGAASHLVTTTLGVTTYTASFGIYYLLTTSSNPMQGGQVGDAPPGSGGYYPAGTVVNLTATPNSGYSFAGWTGNVASSNSAMTTITLSQPQTVVANFTASSGAPSLGSVISGKTGPSNARVWSIALTNGGTSTATAVKLTAFGLTQSFGAACVPAIATAMPLTIGDIAPAATGTAAVTVDFSKCAATARFTVNYSYSATNAGVASKTFFNQFQ